MSAGNEPAAEVDFVLAADQDKRRKYMLYYKRPQGMPIPTGKTWRCVCKTVHVFNGAEEQFCPKCGSCLQHQVNAKPDAKYHTCVIVGHFHPRR